MKFPVVLIDENLSWKEHIKYLENKIAENNTIHVQGKTILDKESLLALCCSHNHSYLNYATLTWGSAYRTNLKKNTLSSKTRYSNTRFFYKQPN